MSINLIICNLLQDAEWERQVVDLVAENERLRSSQDWTDKDISLGHIKEVSYPPPSGINWIWFLEVLVSSIFLNLRCDFQTNSKESPTKLQEELAASESHVHDLKSLVAQTEEEKRRIKLHLDEFISENANLNDQVKM